MMGSWINVGGHVLMDKILSGALAEHLSTEHSEETEDTEDADAAESQAADGADHTEVPQDTEDAEGGAVASDEHPGAGFELNVQDLEVAADVNDVVGLDWGPHPDNMNDENLDRGADSDKEYSNQGEDVLGADKDPFGTDSDHIVLGSHHKHSQSE